MLSIVLKLFFAVVFVIFVCIFAYKITYLLCSKIIDLCFNSVYSSVFLCALLALFFCTVGVMQLKDFIQETHFDLSAFFPLSFLVAGICLYLGYRIIRKKRLTK